jgi:hypothetical protein
MKKVIYISIGFMFLALSGFAQVAPKPFAIKTDKGIGIVCNNGNKSFVFEIPGNKIESAQGGGMLFVVDGKLVQINFVSLETLANTKKIVDNPDTVSMLKLHQIWEMDYQSKEIFKQPLSAEGESEIKLTLAKGKFQDSLFWYYKRPKDETSAYIGDAFQSIQVGNVVAIVGTSLEPNDDISKRKEYLTKVLSSLVLMDKEINPNPTKPKAKAKPTVKPTVKRKTRG